MRDGRKTVIVGKIGNKQRNRQQKTLTTRQKDTHTNRLTNKHISKMVEGRV